jgi:hypothetical protein
LSEHPGIIDQLGFRKRVTKMKKDKCMILLGLALGLAVAFNVGARSAGKGNPNPRILPVDSHAYGTSYSELAAEWWKWALQTDPNPVADPTGEYCCEGQQGKVWFLAGTFEGNVVRQCTVPAGKAIFFPIVNSVWWDPEDVLDYLGGDEAAYALLSYEEKADILYELVGAFIDMVDILECEIDGVPVQDLYSYRVQSPPFSSTLAVFGDIQDPPYPNADMERDPLTADGYWLLLAPLSAGEHTIWFSGGITGGFVTEVTYELTVEKAKRPAPKRPAPKRPAKKPKKK